MFEINELVTKLTTVGQPLTPVEIALSTTVYVAAVAIAVFVLVWMASRFFRFVGGVVKRSRQYMHVEARKIDEYLPDAPPYHANIINGTFTSVSITKVEKWKLRVRYGWLRTARPVKNNAVVYRLIPTPCGQLHQLPLLDSNFQIFQNGEVVNRIISAIYTFEEPERKRELNDSYLRATNTIIEQHLDREERQAEETEVAMQQQQQQQSQQERRNLDTLTRETWDRWMDDMDNWIESAIPCKEVRRQKRNVPQTQRMVIRRRFLG